MKKIILSVLLFSAVPIYSQAETPALAGAQVTIPYGELKELLRAANLNEITTPKPPVESVLTDALYRLDFSSGTPVFTAEFKARTFTGNWQTLNLFGGSPRLESSDETVSMVWRDKAYTLLTNQIGDFTARINLTIPPVSQWGEKKGFLFHPASANRTVFTVSGLPPGKMVKIGNLIPTSSKANEFIYQFSGDEGEVNIYLEDEVEDAPILPSDWTLHSQVMIRYVEGRLQYSARIQAQADSGSGLSMDLLLPPNISRVTLEGDDLETWKLAPRAKDSRLINLAWKTPDTLDRTLLLTWETPQSALSDSWTIIPPRVATSGESKTLIAMLPIDGLELTHPSIKAAGDSRRLPEWLRQEVGAEDCLIAEISGGDELALTANWLPRLKTAQATISLAKFETRLVSDGSMLVSADYTVQHSDPINWILELPSADEILTCEINRKSANPIQREANQIEFRLSSPANTSKELETTIHLCYALKAEALDPVSGQVTLELPRTDLFIHHLDWALIIPDSYEPTAVQGNVQISTGSKSTGDLIHLEKDLCRGERPAVEIYYQRKDLTTGS